MHKSSMLRLLGPVVLSAATATVGLAQTQATDTKGEGPIALSNKYSAGILQLTSAEKKAGLRYLHQMSGDSPFFALEASASIENGLGSIFSTGEINPGGKLSIAFGKTGLILSSKGAAKNVDWAYLKASLAGEKIVSVDQSLPYDQQSTKHVFSGAEVSGAYNQFGTLFSLETVYSVGFGYKRENNSDDLKPVEIITESKTTDPVSGGTRTVRRNVSGVQGAYEERDTYPVTLDLFVKPDATPLGISLFAHQILARGKPKSNFGAGLWVLNEKNTSQSRIGVVGEFRDAFDAYPGDDTGTLGKRFVASLFVGLPLFTR